MASPALQSFCCANDLYKLYEGGSNQTVHDNVLRLTSNDYTEFRTFNILCLVASVFGMMGAIYQLSSRKSTFYKYRSENDVAVRVVLEQNDVIVWLTIADLLATLGLLARSSLWLASFMPHTTDSRYSGEKTILCVFINEWIQYFFICSYIWTFFFAVNLCIMARNSHNRLSWLWLYHVISWPLAAVLCTCGSIPLYWPSLSKCVASSLMLIPNYATMYLTLIFVLVSLPFIYLGTYRYTYSYRSMEGVRDLQNDECQQMGDLKCKYFSFVLIFYVCWLPNIVVGCLLIAPPVPRSLFTIFWELTAILNPSQPTLNCFALHGIGRRQPQPPRTWVMPRSTVDGLVTAGYYPDEERTQVEDDRQTLIFGDE